MLQANSQCDSVLYACACRRPFASITLLSKRISCSLKRYVPFLFMYRLVDYVKLQMYFKDIKSENGTKEPGSQDPGNPSVCSRK